jgi:RNA polymerase sigma-70 factor (ECF subfamily)
MLPVNDIELFKNLSNGDKPAFQALFVKYYSSLCHFANHILKDRQKAEESVQDFFVNLWEKHTAITIQTGVKQYFFQAVKNNCLNQLKQQKVRLAYEKKIQETYDPELNPDQYFMEIELQEKIEKSIQAMPAKRQEIFRLSREKGMKYIEIADFLNISVKTVEAQMGLALKHLRDSLHDYRSFLINLFIIRKNN